MQQPVIVAAVRTPFGRFGGVLSGIGATELGGLVIGEAIRRAGIEPAQVDECIMGMVLPCGYGQNPARQAAIKAGLAQQVTAFTVNKVCGSGLKAVMLAAQAIRCGDAEVIVAGGMESMSRAPYYLERARWGYRMGPGTIEDHMVHDGLWDVVNDFHMGMSNEIISAHWHVSREEQDRFAQRSYDRALKAIDRGLLQAETMAVPLPGRGDEAAMVTVDECPRPTSYDQLRHMRPVFKPDGVGTAGNSSAISDGAAALVVMSSDKARILGCPVMAAIGSQASAGIELEHVLMAPIHAIPKVLDKEGVTLEEIDLFEINEAFSGSSVAINRVLGLDPERVNVNGGCVALGHPIGASGARLVVTLVHEMVRRQVKRGLVSLCLGGGEAVAMVVNR